MLAAIVGPRHRVTEPKGAAVRLGKTPILMIAAGGLLGTVGFGGLLFAITGHSTQTTVVDQGGHAVIPGLARDGALPQPTAIPAATATPEPTATPTAAAGPPSVKGLRVWAGGDSVGAFVAQNFAQDLVAAGATPECSTTEAADGEVDNTCYFWKISTGLARLDYFDWLGKLQQIANDDHPQITLFMAGGNDAQTLIAADGSPSGLAPFSDAWNAAYAQRVSQAMDSLTSNGGYAIWVGMPVMLDANEYPGFNANMQKLNAIFAAQAATHARVAYVDAYSLLSDSQGNFAQSLPDIHGVVQQMRAADGVHLTEQGGEFLAQHAIQTLFTLMEQQPAATP